MNMGSNTCISLGSVRGGDKNWNQGEKIAIFRSAMNQIICWWWVNSSELELTTASYGSIESQKGIEQLL